MPVLVPQLFQELTPRARTADPVISLGRRGPGRSQGSQNLGQKPIPADPPIRGVRNET